jgi:predicted acyl esterase
MDYSKTTDAGMRIQRNVTVPMRDGKLLRVDLYRPDHADEPLPVLIAWSPYGKHGQLDWRYWPGNDVPTEDLSPYTCFETPDPAYWTRHGYAVIMADARGTWGSEGNVTMGGPAEARACYDLIEWAGTQDWSNGKAGMAGVSWYAVIQWAVAALQPPHLAAINPWEGWSDLYYEVVTHAGIPETAFVPMLAPLIGYTHEQVEDVAGLAMEHPFDDEYWASKRPDLTAIQVPAFVVASWSDHGLHTRGTSRATATRPRRRSGSWSTAAKSGRTTTSQTTCGDRRSFLTGSSRTSPTRQTTGTRSPSRSASATTKARCATSRSGRWRAPSTPSPGCTHVSVRSGPSRPSRRR